MQTYLASNIVTEGCVEVLYISSLEMLWFVGLCFAQLCCVDYFVRLLKQSNVHSI